MRAGRIVMLVIGSICALMALGLLLAGAGLGAALATQRDAHGFFTTSNQPFHTRTAAVTTESIDLGSPGPDEWWADRELATVRLRARAAGGARVFIGVGRTADVERFLAGVPHAEITDVEFDPFSATYRRHDPLGSATPTPPAAAKIWSASANGPGTQSVTWSLRSGHWTVVVMNSNARAGVLADIDVGVKVKYLVPLMWGLLGSGLLLLIIAVGLILGGALHRGAGAGLTNGVAAGDDSAIHAYPLQLEGHLDPSLSRWQWLVKWFLAIPHFIVLVFLWIAFWVLSVVAWFSILFTGRYPRSIFDFNVGVLRWSWRVGFYATSVLGTDQYPPFSLAASDGPATLDVVYPEQLSRGLVLVKSWLLAIPQLVIVGLFTNAAVVDRGRGGAGMGLLGLLVFIAVIALLFTRRYPRGLFDFVMGINRWVYRVIAYVALMTDEYPPFRLDQGPEEPGLAKPRPSEPAPVEPAPVEPAPVVME